MQKLNLADIIHREKVVIWNRHNRHNRHRGIPLWMQRHIKRA